MIFGANCGSSWWFMKIRKQGFTLAFCSSWEKNLSGRGLPMTQLFGLNGPEPYKPTLFSDLCGFLPWTENLGLNCSAPCLWKDSGTKKLYMTPSWVNPAFSSPCPPPPTMGNRKQGHLNTCMLASLLGKVSTLPGSGVSMLVGEALVSFLGDIKWSRAVPDNTCKLPEVFLFGHCSGVQLKSYPVCGPQTELAFTSLFLLQMGKKGKKGK